MLFLTGLASFSSFGQSIDERLLAIGILIVSADPNQANEEVISAEAHPEIDVQQLFRDISLESQDATRGGGFSEAQIFARLQFLSAYQLAIVKLQLKIRSETTGTTRAALIERLVYEPGHEAERTFARILIKVATERRMSGRAFINFLLNGAYGISLVALDPTRPANSLGSPRYPPPPYSVFGPLDRVVIRTDGAPGEISMYDLSHRFVGFGDLYQRIFESMIATSLEATSLSELHAFGRLFQWLQTSPFIYGEAGRITQPNSEPNYFSREIGRMGISRDYDSVMIREYAILITGLDALELRAEIELMMSYFSQNTANHLMLNLETALNRYIELAGDPAELAEARGLVVAYLAKAAEVSLQRANRLVDAYDREIADRLSGLGAFFGAMGDREGVRASQSGIFGSPFINAEMHDAVVARANRESVLRSIDGFSVRLQTRARNLGLGAQEIQSTSSLRTDIAILRAIALLNSIPRICVEGFQRYFWP